MISPQLCTFILLENVPPLIAPWTSTVTSFIEASPFRVIDCGIGYYDFSAQIYQPCAFGPNASIVPADVEGTIEVAMTVDGVETV